MNKAVFIIATQYDNLGDLIINKCLIDELSLHVDLYVDFKNVSSEFVEIILRNPSIKSLNEIYNLSFKDSRILMFYLKSKVRFSYFFKSPGPIGGSSITLKNSIKGFIFSKILKSISSKIGKSYIVGSEINLNSVNDAKKFKKTNARYEKIYLRSISNINNLKEFDIQNTEYIPDLCFLLKDKIHIEENNNRKKVGISFRDLSDSELKNNILASVETFVNFYSTRNYDIVFLYQVDRDHEFNSYLYSLHAKRNNVSLMENSLDYDSIDIYNHFEAVMSNRLHVLLLGFLHNCIAFPIVDDNKKTSKIKDIFQSIDSSLPVNRLLKIEDLEMVNDAIDVYKEEVVKINDIQYKMCKKKISSIFDI